MEYEARHSISELFGADRLTHWEKNAGQGQLQFILCIRNRKSPAVFTGFMAISEQHTTQNKGVKKI